MGVFRVTLSQIHFGCMVQNVLHFKKSDSVDADRATLAAEIVASYIPNMKTRQSQNLTYTQIRVHVLGESLAPYVLNVSTPGTVTGSAQELTFVSHVVRLNTAFAGRRGRGRWYIGGVPLNLSSSGILSSAAITAWNTVLASIMAVWGPSGSSNFDLGVQNGSESDDFHAVTALTLNPIPRVQRRRNLGVGI